MDEQKITRYNPNPKDGLTKEELQKRIEQGLVNYDTTVKTKTEKQIIKDNIFTPFNFLNFFLAITILLVGSYKNLMFLGVVISNSIISIIQEIRSKRTIDKLSLLAEKKVTVIREKQKQEVHCDEIVLDDIMEVKTGNQIVADSILVSGECEVNEAFITGESDPVTKRVGDTLLSGSFVVSGKCLTKVEHIGLQNYTAKISKEAKYVKKVNSEIMNTLNRIVKIISIIILPLGIGLFYRQLSISGTTTAEAVVHTVAALVVMIPEGLVLLTSVVLAVSVIRLAKHKVLVQELYCIETLARVDVICLDKTGTITEGNMEVADMIPLDQKTQENLSRILGSFAYFSEDENATIEAIREHYQQHYDWTVQNRIAFSSDKKYSAIEFEKEGTYILGAPEFIQQDLDKKLSAQIKLYSKDNRVVALFHSNQSLPKKDLPNDAKPIALLLIKDKIRNEAKQTLDYFKEQGVTIKIISGDNTTTVSNIAKSLELEGAEQAIDVSTLTTPQALEQAADQYTIFGRVSPEQKKALVIALKKQGHTVAMTGDGVNDILALKEADCSIAMSSGSDGARNVSQLVLLDSNFDAMPKVVAEGRRSINNIERSSTLFLSKTIYATLLAIYFLFIHLTYPFQPIQLTLISVATIGIPSFILALEPNKERVKGRFFRNVMAHSLPTSLTIVFHIIILSIISAYGTLQDPEVSTLAVLLTAYVGFLLLNKLCKPYNWLRGLLMISMIIFFLFQYFYMKNFYSLMSWNIIMYLIGGSLLIIDTYFYHKMNQFVEYSMQHSKLLKHVMYGKQQNQS